MGNYKAQYERYYGNVKSKGTGAKYKSIGSANNGIRNSGNSNIPNKIATKLIWQFGGAFVLIGLLLIIKEIPLEGTKEAYTVSKKMIDEKFDVNEAVMAINIPDPDGYKEKVLDYIDEAKSFMIGEKTLKETIKEEYAIPTVGKKKVIDESDKGIAIVTDGDKDVNASFDGIVREINEEDGSKHIVVDNGNGIETYYGLLSEVKVNEGDEIKKGQNIGKTGSIDSSGTKGMIFKIIYMGNEKDPNEMMDLSSLEEV
ncbi:M23 family metallopeptidase [Clostridium sp. SHJSY1]|uniref:M23 family metallopeptidase n=1 Tax=Clostridium sp. SHJSY1 TaxID=2942483 RepID=UPI0028769039|nr:M23 family metallopeptidase [Clostridium sp. SHJSY1]MDS0528024.1 M23 family metallopeptidase [Clostridium sp. SHJSY1]